MFKNHGHNDLDESPRFYPVIRAFIRKASPANDTGK
ncbi:hypothetical protein V5J35_004475 [Endozoicomonas sp. NE40]|uniref:Esterase n=1 Tax=Endozoicomonas lisbonensis TaxID=3120522 RepID=A0ABV2SQY1_9GAMM